ncbi:MAG: EAL domain-containing protein [Gammaproteobacteria bacterium]|nr:EAL domain-containing protein [Gammaproteobacteria bacterium]
MRDAVLNLHDGRIRYLSLPAGKISADFFCTAEHPQNGWFGLLADATGHGLPAAIFGLHTPTLFRQAVQRGMSLAEIFDEIHGFLARQRFGGYFVCGLLIRSHGREIEVLNAGMPDGLLLAPDGRLLEAFPSRHLPLGIESDAKVAEQRFRLARGDDAVLLLYSDGLSELGSASGQPLETAGVLAAAASVGATGTFDDLAERIARQTTPPHDDISIAMIQLPLETRHAEIEKDSALAPKSIAPVNVEHATRTIVEQFDDGMVLTDAMQRIIYVNPAFTRITGYTLEEAVGRTPRLLSSGRHGATFYRDMHNALADCGIWNGEIWNRRKDGTIYMEALHIKALQDEAGRTKHYLARFSDLTEERLRASAIRQDLSRDPLTGLADRATLHERGRQAMQRTDRSERVLGVLFIDLDRFKSINDSLGHDIGDAVLVEVARRFAGTLRENDLLARFAGDEFVCLLPDIASRQDTALVCGKLLGVLAEPVTVAGHHFKIGASIGISTFPANGTDFEDLVVFADRAMRRAKQAGGNIYRFFDTGMAQAAEHQLELEARIDAALRNNQLELHFQPKLDLNSRQILGAEALVRWRDPQQGLIPPGSFIPIAEKSDLIAAIGNWVLTEACAALARFDGTLPDYFHVAINVSPMQLVRCDLAAEVADALATSGITPGRLQLEVTESLFIQDAEQAASVLRRIAGLGVTLALDDFGTGYSNLGSLGKLPLDSFKLDQSFVRNVHASSDNNAIARAANHLATGLGKEIIAEGIESCRECTHLKKLGYRIGQGFAFGKPMPEAEFLDFFRNWSPGQCPN